MEIEPIGYLRTCYGSKFAVPRQPGLCPAAWGELEFMEKYRSRESIRGLEDFSHVWLIFGFHETAGEGWKPTVRPPRLGGNQRVGVFASRSTYRPNGLGLSLVKLDEIVLTKDGELQPPILKFSGVDLVDGTPIYDIKPYLPYAENLLDAKAGFAGDEIGRMEVKVEEAAMEKFSALEKRAQQVICEVLSLDPRPATSAKDSSKTYGALLCGKNVRFRFDDVTCWISAVESIK
ncbi:tRNA (N6-threonylcarbamoyladenosine(37)-N6)-methyltransferase TrmO [Luteolibacter algae]|uniref:tRNA (N6-threonylcarbamoyladenosine(37)-N6)-methyltransferase TrmO n=1 Tax=Luteolibacter algae TaxID=454151 RepID=A0ABW5D8L0_9BACT